MIDSRDARSNVGDVVEVQWPAAARARTAAELDVEIVGPDESVMQIPAFRLDDATWAFRFVGLAEGLHRWRVTEGDEAAGTLDILPAPVAPGAGRMPAPVTAERDMRHLLAPDGSPFLWLADTWWYAASDRISGAQLERLARKRFAEGYSVIQLVAGLYPEIPPLDPRGIGDGRLPWDAAWEEMDSRWWTHFDRRVRIVLRSGLVPAIYGAWGYYLAATGVSTIKRHWREIVARYAAYPVAWSVAGEATMPWYDLLFTDEAGPVQEELAAGWLEVARYIRAIDPYRRPLSAHPAPGVQAFATPDMFDDPDVIDHVLLQTGHWERTSFQLSIDTLCGQLAVSPARPVLNSEVCYEGIAGSNWPDTQRFLFWSHMLSGAAGHTYGAQGLWAMNDGTYVGRMGRWGSATWMEAAELPGGTQLGAGRRWLLERPWGTLRPSPGIVDPHASEGDRIGPYAATLDDGRRIVYFPVPAFVERPGEGGFKYARIRLSDLPPGSMARLDWYDPRTCDLFESTDRLVEADGTVEVTGSEICALPSMEDWLLEISEPDLSGPMDRS